MTDDDRTEQLREALRREGVDSRAYDWNSFSAQAVDWGGIDFHSRDDIERAVRQGGLE